MGLVKRLIAVLGVGWYDWCWDDPPELNGESKHNNETSGKDEGKEIREALLDALKAAAQANFGKDEAIKPLVTYLAANLYDGAFLPPFTFLAC